MKILGGQIVILLDNSFEGMVKTDGDSILSAKHSGYGIGTASVKSITAKYQGTVNFEWEEAVFHVSVRLNDGAL